MCIALGLAVNYSKPSLVWFSTSNWFISMASISKNFSWKRWMVGFVWKYAERVHKVCRGVTAFSYGAGRPTCLCTHPVQTRWFPWTCTFGQGGQRLQWKLCGTFGKAAPDIEMSSCCSWKGRAVVPVEKSTWDMVIKPTRSLNSRVLGDKFQPGITWTRTNLMGAEVDDSC